jgi:hypothetical protein
MHKNIPKHIIVLVDCPNPLSIRSAGTVSSIIFGQADTEIPAVKENTNLAANINSQLSQIDRKVAMIEIILQARITFILPFFKMFPLKSEPTPSPAIESVDSIMFLELVSSSDHPN